jgi:hypothetical protein
MKLTQITPNLHRINHTSYAVYFSYETPIAVYDKFGDRWYVSENIWTRTTGKHLNQIKALHSNHEVVSHDSFQLYLFDII